jgi:hypothetical protein
LSKIWTLFFGLILCVNGQAHSLSTTAIDLYKVNGLWVAQFTISQEGANIALEETWGQSLQSFDAQEFKEKYITYIKERVHLSSNDQTIYLGEGGIKLGAHETKMTFMLPDLAPDFDQLNMHIPLFESLEGQHTIVRIDTEEGQVKAILKSSNSFKAYFSCGEINYLSTLNVNSYIWLGLGVVFIFALVLFYYLPK